MSFHLSRYFLGALLIGLAVPDRPAYAEYQEANFEVTEVLTSVTGPSYLNPEIYPPIGSNLLLDDPQRSYDFYCTDFATDGETRSGQFLTLGWDTATAQVFFYGERGTVSEFYTGYAGSQVARFSILREGLGPYAITGGNWASDVTEGYELSYNGADAGSELKGQRVVKRSITYSGTCRGCDYDADGNCISITTKACPTEPKTVSCTEVWQVVGVETPFFTDPKGERDSNWIRDLSQFVKDLLPRDDSEGDIQVKTRTASTGPRG